MKGTVKFFNDTKEFVFIAAEDRKELFVHQTALGKGVRLSEGDSVISKGSMGELVRAKKVQGMRAEIFCKGIAHNLKLIG